MGVIYWWIHTPVILLNQPGTCTAEPLQGFNAIHPITHRSRLFQSLPSLASVYVNAFLSARWSFKCSEQVHFSHRSEKCAVRVATIFITSGQIIQSLSPCGPSQMKHNTFQVCVSLCRPLFDFKDTDVCLIFCVCRRVWCWLWLRAPFFMVRLCSLYPHMVLPCPRKTMWKGQRISAVW